MRTRLEGRAPWLAANIAVAVLICCRAVTAADPASDGGAQRVRIKRLPVDSTNLASAGYDREARVLEVEFKSGAVYRYLAVQPAVFEELMHAASKGRYFIREVRGKYEFHLVREVQP